MGLINGKLYGRHALAKQMLIKIECKHCKSILTRPQYIQSHGDKCSWKGIDMDSVYNDLKNGLSIPKTMDKYSIKEIMCRNMKRGKYPNYPKITTDARAASPTCDNCNNNHWTASCPFTRYSTSDIRLHLGLGYSMLKLSKMTNIQYSSIKKVRDGILK